MMEEKNWTGPSKTQSALWVLLGLLCVAIACGLALSAAKAHPGSGGVESRLTELERRVGELERPLPSPASDAVENIDRVHEITRPDR
jgi:hypothetical protein